MKTEITAKVIKHFPGNVYDYKSVVYGIKKGNFGWQVVILKCDVVFTSYADGKCLDYYFETIKQANQVVQTLIDNKTK